MKIDIISLFPEFFDAFFSHSIINRAIEAGRLDMAVTNPRDFSHNKHGQVDDTPYGGGAGMLMMAPPIFEAVESVASNYDSAINGNYETDEICDEMSLIGNPGESIRRRIVFMGPTGQPFTQEKARELATYDQLILVCGHYEGAGPRYQPSGRCAGRDGSHCRRQREGHRDRQRRRGRTAPRCEEVPVI